MNGDKLTSTCKIAGKIKQVSGSSIAAHPQDATTRYFPTTAMEGEPCRASESTSAKTDQPPETPMAAIATTTCTFRPKKA